MAPSLAGGWIRPSQLNWMKDMAPSLAGGWIRPRLLRGWAELFELVQTDATACGDSLCVGEKDALTVSATVTTLAGERLLQQSGLLLMSWCAPPLRQLFAVGLQRNSEEERQSPGAGKMVCRGITGSTWGGWRAGGRGRNPEKPLNPAEFLSSSAAPLGDVRSLWRERGKTGTVRNKAPNSHDMFS
ncbi:unnamed protein product [Tetraodon nigroviridis]|uniref:(spotted green pufferfish) hypothetical protein n=1 Tax=Tetraodon nigroviridis TaxID=99883 RepID=Q4RWE8_TETNG|nr:unnamed protein product [Tetraodon nigroviridis]